MKFQAPRGTHDLLPDEIGEWLFIENAFREVCARYSYREIRTPLFEDTDLFVRTTGETSDIVTKQMYTFTDPGGERYTLRPEATPSVVRAILEHSLSHGMPLLKLYYIGAMFRWERPQAGRFRQFHQCGVEAIGSLEPAVDAETICLGWDFLQAIGVGDYEIHLNSIGCPVCRPTYREKLVGSFRNKEAALCKDCQNRLERNPLRVLDCKEESCRALTEHVPKTLDYLCDECRQHFEAVLDILELIGIPYVLNHRLVRGLDYYTKTAFEFLHSALGAQNAILGGGRYDGLVEECGGPPTPGVGFACGVERLITVRRQIAQGQQAVQGGMTDVFLATVGDGTQEAALKLLYQLRRVGLRADLDYFKRSLKAKMRYANKLRAKLVIIVGGDEMERGTVTVRDMHRSEQKELPISEVVEQVVKWLNG